MSTPPGVYQLNWVREFFANYICLVKAECPKGTPILNRPNREYVPIRGVVFDISARTINRILFGPAYEAPPAVPDFEYRMRNASG